MVTDLRKSIVTIFTAILFITITSSFSHGASEKNSNSRMKVIDASQYTDTNKKVLNIGGAYYHKIEKGDTIWGTLILKNDVDPNHYNYYLKELLKLNPQIKDPNLIYTGDTLVVPHIAEEHKKQWEPKKARKEAPKPVAKEKPAPKLKNIKRVTAKKQEAAKVTKKKAAPKPPPIPYRKKSAPEKRKLAPKMIVITPPRYQPPKPAPKPKKKVKKAEKPKPKPKPVAKEKPAPKPKPKPKPKKKLEPPKVSDKLKFAILREFPPEKIPEKKEAKKKPVPVPKPVAKVKPVPKPKPKPVVKEKPAPKPKPVAKVKPVPKPEPIKIKVPKKAVAAKKVEKPKVPKKAEAKVELKVPAAGAPSSFTPGQPGSKLISTAVSSKTVVVSKDLKSALESFNDKVVTKGTLYFPLKGKKPLKLDNALFPVVYNGEKKIIMDYGNKIEREDEKYVQSKFEFYSFVDINKGDSEKTVFGKILKSSGYHSVRENREIKVGKNVKLVIRYDWLLEKDADSFLNGTIHLIRAKANGEEKIQPYVKEYLEKFGFHISEVKVLKRKRALPKNKKGAVISLGSPGNAKDTVRKVLEVMEVTHREAAALKFHSEDKPSVYADFYFEIGERSYLINLKPSSDEKRALAKEYGLTLLDLDPKESRKNTIKKVLNLLQKDYRYGTFRLLGGKTHRPFMDIEVRGFFIGKKARSLPTVTGMYYERPPVDDENIFVTEFKIPPIIKRLSNDFGIDVIEK